MKDFISDLRTAAWRTAGARYNAARRLKQRETFSTFSLALLSALSVAAAVAQRIYSPQPGTALDNYLTAVSVAMGIFLLTISLLEWGAANGAKSDGLHRNAEELTAYQIKLKQNLAQMDLGKVLTDAEVDGFRIEYESIKNRCAHNHNPRDYGLFRAQQRRSKEFATAPGGQCMSRLEALGIWLIWEWSTVWFFLLVWIAVAVIGIYAWWVPKA